MARTRRAYSYIYKEDNSPYPNVKVVVKLVYPQWDINYQRLYGAYEFTTYTDENGRWELELVVNEDLEPYKQTYYTVTCFRPATNSPFLHFSFYLPYGDGSPVNIGTLLVGKGVKQPDLVGYVGFPVRSINHLTGEIFLRAGEGIEITENPNTSEITISNTGVLSLNGLTGAVEVDAADGVRAETATQTNRVIILGDWTNQLPRPVGATSQLGTDHHLIPADHVHEGVHSINELTGDVQFLAAGNLTVVTNPAANSITYGSVIDIPANRWTLVLNNQWWAQPMTTTEKWSVYDVDYITGWRAYLNYQTDVTDILTDNNPATYVTLANPNTYIVVVLPKPIFVSKVAIAPDTSSGSYPWIKVYFGRALGLSGGDTIYNPGLIELYDIGIPHAHSYITFSLPAAVDRIYIYPTGVNVRVREIHDIKWGHMVYSKVGIITGGTVDLSWFQWIFSTTQNFVAGTYNFVAEFFAIEALRSASAKARGRMYSQSGEQLELGEYMTSFTNTVVNKWTINGTVAVPSSGSWTIEWIVTMHEEPSLEYNMRVGMLGMRFIPAI